MIAQTQKPIEEILEYLEGKEKIVIAGCGGCATIFHTGGEPEVKEMAKKLTEEGKKVLAAIAPPLGEFACYAPWSKARLNQYRKEIEESDAVLMLSCGDGLQVVRELILEEEFKIIKPIFPGTNPIGHMGGGPTLFNLNYLYSRTRHAITAWPRCGDVEKKKIEFLFWGILW